MSLPNAVTLLRIALIPLVIALIFMHTDMTQRIAFALFVFAALTDYVDGYLARKMNLITPLGRMLDPIADKLLVGALLVALAFEGSFDERTIWAALIIMTREIAVAGLREFLGPMNVVIKASFIAKTKTTVQLFALGLIILIPLVPNLASAANGMLWAAMALTLYSGYEYFAGAWPHLKETKQ